MGDCLLQGFNWVSFLDFYIWCFGLFAYIHIVEDMDWVRWIIAGSRDNIRLETGWDNIVVNAGS